MKKFLLILPLSFLVSCEEVIDLPLHESDPLIVIEGKITNLPGPYLVRITRTTDFYSPGPVPPVTGATVFVSDDKGNSWYFTEKRSGYYYNDRFTGMPGTTYSLLVESGGMTYRAMSHMPQPVPIDSLDVEYFAGTRFSDPGYYIIMYFTDPPGKGNYYRVRLYKGKQAGTAIYVLDDKLVDGNQVNIFLFGSTYQPGDTAVAELQSIDESVYRYLLTLSEVNASSPSGSGTTPANPDSNLSGGALGYFGALTITRDTLVIPPLP